MAHELSPTRLLTALAASAALTVPALAVAQRPDSVSVAQGARDYSRICSRCHNPRSPLERTDRDWVTILEHMRVRGNMTGGQARSVLAFLQATNGNPQVPLANMGQPPKIGTQPITSDTTTIAQGKRLVTEKACVGCHVVGGGGGTLGPSLNGVVARRGSDFVRHKLADPTFNNATSMMPNFGLSAEQIEAILAYLHTLDGRS